jgi:carboxyl-terminal processing protease
MSFPTNRIFLFTLILFGLSLQENIALPQPAATMESETRWAVDTVNRQHYLKSAIPDLSGKEILDAYMRSLDPSKLFFTQVDFDEFNFRFSDAFELFMSNGNLYPAFAIYGRFFERLESRVEWVRERLEQPFDFFTDATYITDRRELDWPVDEAQADAIWHDRLLFELLNEILSSSQDNSFADEENSLDESNSDNAKDKKSLDEAALQRLADDPEFLQTHLKESRAVVMRRHDRSLRFNRDKDAWELQEAMINAMTRLFDPHSNFFSADTLEDFNTSVQNAFFGIGAVLFDNDGYCTIRELTPGGPAEASRQLHPEDAILAVAQGDNGEFVDVIDMRLRHIVNMIRGKKNTVVRLLIRPGDSNDPSARREVRLVRDEIQLTANMASARVFSVPADESAETFLNIGVIELPSFYGNLGGSADGSSTTADVRELIDQLRDKGIDALILDLRTNGGGLLSEAVRLTGAFIPGGPVVQVRSADGKVDVLSDPGEKMAWHGPMAVLTSRFSASASEIVAGALRDHGRAIVIGDSSTHGKGTVQQVFQAGARQGFFTISRSRPVAAKVTVSQFFLPKGDSTQLQGVPSDIVLPSANEFLPIGESDLKNPLPWKAIEPAKWHHAIPTRLQPNMVNDTLLERLRALSHERIATLPEFVFLREQIDWRRERREETAVSLNLRERIERRIADEALSVHFNDTFEHLAKDNFAEEAFILKLSALLEERSKLVREQNGEVDEKEDEKEPKLDIALREALRIMADWLRSLRVETSPQSQS